MASRRLNILLGVALIALVVRLVYVWQISHAPFFDLRFGDARAYHRTAVEGWLDNADLRLNFAVALAEVHDEQHALDELDAAAALRPGDPRAYLAAGRLLLTLSRPDEARNAFQQAVAADPRSADAHDGLGKALEAAGRVEEAKEEFARARALDPNAGRDGPTR
jgi:tetratricopeptide (TPR) repeat protein